jgi:glutamyl-tRNA reductase
MKTFTESAVDPSFLKGELRTVASIILVGTSFKTAPMDFREFFAKRLLSDGVLKNPLPGDGLLESSVIETCNRVEIYIVSNEPDKSVKEVLSRLGGVSADRYYVKTGLDAVRHIFKVSSGLDSLVVGEEQILRQVRNAGINARVNGNAKSILSSLFDVAYNVGKRARTSYGTSQANKSVSSFALSYALKQLGRQPKKVLLVGTGETAKLASLQLRRARIFLFSRRKDTSSRFPKAVRVAHSKLKSVASECDLVIAATKHEGYILKRGDVPTSWNGVLLDLAFPRNIDPSIRSSGSVRLYDLDDIANHAKSLPKTDAVTAIEKLVDYEGERFHRELTASRLTPLLAGIYSWAENIREGEAKLALRRLSQPSERDRRVVEAMSRRLVSKLMAPHAAFVKQQGKGLSQAERLRLLEKVFRTADGE